MNAVERYNINGVESILSALGGAALLGAAVGCGPVGQFAIRSCFMLGAERVIAIHDVPERLAMAEAGGAELLSLRGEEHPFERLQEMTGGRGPDACIDAVGMEAHGVGLDNIYDRAKLAVRSQTDRPTALGYALHTCRKGGTVSLPGVYGGIVDKIEA